MHVFLFQRGKLVLWFGIIDKEVVLILGNSWGWAMLIRSLCIRATYDLFGCWMGFFFSFLTAAYPASLTIRLHPF